VVGNDHLGGNYWGRPDGTGFSDVTPDADGDGFCDDAYVLPGRTGTDHLPLSEGPLASVADSRYSASSAGSSGSAGSAGSAGSTGSGTGSAGSAGAKSTETTSTGTTTSATLVAGSTTTLTAGNTGTITTEMTVSQGESYGGVADPSGPAGSGGGAASATTVAGTGTATPTGTTPTGTGTTPGTGAAAGDNSAAAPSTPGFGAVVALVGLGTVAVLALRKE
jgi:PGF-CTERM protein